MKEPLTFILVAFSQYFNHGVLCLRLHHLWVPDMAMRNGSGERSAILDCDYTLDQRDENSLEVKWYFRHEETPIYQWVPPQEPQILSPRFMGHINLGYRATTDPLSERRALHLVDLTTKHSGRYSCRVSSNYEDEFRSKNLLIYAPPRSTNLALKWTATSSGEFVLNSTCHVKGAFPQPTVTLSVKSTASGAKSYDITNQAGTSQTLASADGAINVAFSAFLKFPLVLQVFSATTGSALGTVRLPASHTIVECQASIPDAGFKTKVEERVPELPVTLEEETDISSKTNIKSPTDLLIISFAVLIVLKTMS